MIHLNDLSLAFGGRLLFNQLSWHIKPRQRIGLVGPNGAGKTTLLRVIAEKQHIDEGSIAKSSTTTIGYLEQDTQELETNRTVIDEAMQAFADTLALEQEIETVTAEMARHEDHESTAYPQTPAPPRAHSNRTCGARRLSYQIRLRNRLNGAWFFARRIGAPTRNLLRWLADAGHPG